MNLIKSETVTMSSREIAALVQSRHSDVCRTIERLANNSVIQGYAPMAYTHEQNGQEYKEYHLIKRDSLVVVAQLSPEFTAAVVDRWQELEAKQAPAVPQTYAAALLEAGRLAQLAEEQAEKLAIAAPKVQFVDALVERGALMTATQVGQKHKISAVKLNKILDEVGGIYSKGVKRSRVFTQQWIDKGYGEMKQTELGHSQALFTPSGEYRISEILTSEGLI